MNYQNKLCCDIWTVSEKRIPKLFHRFKPRGRRWFHEQLVWYETCLGSPRDPMLRGATVLLSSGDGLAGGDGSTRSGSATAISLSCSFYDQNYLPHSDKFTALLILTLHNFLHFHVISFLAQQNNLLLRFSKFFIFRQSESKFETLR